MVVKWLVLLYPLGEMSPSWCRTRIVRTKTRDKPTLTVNAFTVDVPWALSFRKRLIPAEASASTINTKAPMMSSLIIGSSSIVFTSL